MVTNTTISINSKIQEGFKEAAKEFNKQNNLLNLSVKQTLELNMKWFIENYKRLDADFKEGLIIKK